MTRLTRSLRCAALAASCMALLVATAPSAVAADIPRPPGAVDNRGYELVTPPDKNQNRVLGPAAVADDGTKAIYSLTGPLVSDPSGVYSMLASTRTEDGWTTQNLLPPLAEMVDRQYLISAVSSDLASVATSSLNGVGLAGSTRVTLAQLAGDGSGAQSILYPFPRYFGLSGVDLVASDDLAHLFVNVPPDIDPSLPGNQPGVANLYDFGGATPTLVGAMPGTGLAPACGIDTDRWNFAQPGQSLQSEHWASADGSRVFFATRGDVCTDPWQLYMRDVDGAETTLISGPWTGVGTDNGIVRFLQAAEDGSWAIYASATSYVASDDDDTNSADVDLYRYNVATRQNACLTCIGVSVDVNVDTSPAGKGRTAISQDGTHVYFTSANRVADAPSAGTPGNPNTYVWRQGHPLIRFVVQASGVTNLPHDGGYVTPDGGTLLFMSDAPGLDVLTGGLNGGFRQLYRYDATSGRVTCLSCPPGGVPARAEVFFTLAQGLGAIVGDAQPASDDGGMVFFTTTEKLVDEDVNDNYDIYEWHDGVTKLITNGVTDYPSDAAPFVVTVTPNGHDLFFADQAQLTADAEDGNYKLYDARIDGGFPPPLTPPQPCHGDCRGSPSAPPALPDPGSASRTDGGNAEPGEAASFAVRKATKRQRARAARSGRIALAVRVSVPGRLEAFAQAKIGKRIRVVARRRVQVDDAGRVRVVLRLSKAARRQLERGKRVRVVAAVSFADALESKRLVIPLRKPRGKGGASGAARRAAVRATADGR